MSKEIIDLTIMRKGSRAEGRALKIKICPVCGWKGEVGPNITYHKLKNAGFFYEVIEYCNIPKSEEIKVHK